MQLMKGRLKHHNRKLMACLVALIMLLSTMGLGSPGTAQAASAASLVVNLLNPDGSTELVKNYSYEDLAFLEETEYYASIDSMPAAVGTKAKGVKIGRLINDAQQYNSNIKWESGQRLVFYVTDSSYAYQPAFYTYSELYGQNRYYYPELVETYSTGTVSLDNAVLVEPMLASSSYQARGATDANLKDTENPVTMDGNDSFRFCMGITEAEATTPGVSTTNKFAKWVYRVDVGPVNGPSLKADTTANEVGQPIEITFTDDTAWREAISQIRLDEDVLSSDQYQATAGKLTINSDAFSQAGDYTITVEAAGFMNSTVKQTINGPPAYTVTFTVTDGTNAIPGATITIAEQNLTTDADGKATIDLEDGTYAYSVTATGFIAVTDGSVTVNGAALAEAVTMTADPAGLKAPPALTADITDNKVGQAVDITFTENETWRKAIASITVDGNALNDSQYAATAGNINLIADIFTAAGDYVIVVKAAGYSDAAVTQTVTDVPSVTIGNIYTVVGNGVAGYAGDGGPATDAQLSYPSGMDMDSAGNLYIADYPSHCVRKVNPAGTITTVAGTGVAGYAGDGGPATSAQLNEPYGVKVDAQGNIYIAERKSDCVRKVDTEGIITTVAGNGTYGYSGDGGQATEAQLAFPSNVEMDSAGNLYIAAYKSNCIRKVDTQGIITTVAGSGSDGYGGDGSAATEALLDDPYGITLDAAGNLYIADTVNNRIRKVDTQGIITTIAGSGPTGYKGANFGGDGGPATGALLSWPKGVAVDDAGNLYIADQLNNRVRKVDTKGIISTVIGNGSKGYGGDGAPAEDAIVSSPGAVMIDSAGNFYIADCGNHCIRLIKTQATQVPPILTADSTDIAIGNSIDITFTDNETWRGAITGITVDDIALTSDQYTVTAGNINMVADIFTEAKDYPIVVQASGYENAIVTQRIIVTDRPGAWDGSIDTSWYNTTDKSFEISTPAELAGLAAIVNGTADGIAQDDFKGKTIVLMADIDLGGIQNQDGTWNPASIEWTTIGGYETIHFDGTLDGNGHVISNIYIEKQASDWQTNEGRMRALVGLNAGVVKNLGVTGYVAANRSVGGVVGCNVGRIENCFNAATVIATDHKGAGGIAGANWCTPSIVNCYNVGSIFGSNMAGGMTGDNEHIISSCYNVGPIRNSECLGAIAGNLKHYANNPIIVQNCYFNSDFNTAGIGSGSEKAAVLEVTAMTTGEMKKAEFVALLNGKNGTAFVQDTSNINNGYPILAWQATTSVRKTAPVLTPDTTNNNLGQSIDITFTDDADWRGVITNVTVNGTALTGDQYTVSAGNINIAASVFTAAGDYTITVPAANYHDTSAITQTIESGTLLTPPALTADSTDNILDQAVDITFTDNEAWRGAVYAVTVNNTALTGDQYTLTAGNINIAAAVFTAPGDYEVIIQASGYNDATATQNIQGKTPPVLTADSVKTAVGQTVNITFNYNEKAWPGAITGITVNGTPLTEDQYTLIAGTKGTMPPYPESPSKIKITGSVFITPGDYEIVVQAGGYADATVIQNKTPVLIPDITDNNIGNLIEITFTDNEPWRTAITAISVDGSDLAADKYTVAAGKISIAADVFTENRNYPLAIQADGYYDAAVLQSIIVSQTMLPGNIYTIAGTGTAGYSGDGGAAVYAQLNKPRGITCDSNGNIYITDAYNHAIRKIDSNGIITTVAGNGTRGDNLNQSISEGVPATEATLSIPGNVAFDSAGNLYIADQFYIRKVDANGIITTVTTTDGDSTIAFDNEDNLYIVNKSAHNISKMDHSGTITTVAGDKTEGYSGDGGSATEAQLYRPWAVTLDSIGNLYIGDRSNNRIRKVDTNGIITTVAGTGTKGYSGDGGPAIEAQLNGPTHVAVDSIGNLYIVDYFNHRVRKVATNGIITTIAGTGNGGYSGDGGPAIEAQLNSPMDVSFDSAGNLYITESNNHCVRFVKAFPAPPSLTADSTDNNVGQAIDITFTDNETWRNTITEIKVGATVLESSQYTKEAGKITVAAGVFTEAKDYTITIEATGYSDATVTQTINEASLSTEVAYTAAGTITAIAPDTVTYADGKFTVPTGVTEFTFQDGDKEMKATFTDGIWTFAEVLTPPTTYTLTLSGAGLTSDPVAGAIAGNTTVTITVTPAQGKRVATFTVNGDDKKAELTGTPLQYTFSITADTTVAVTYEAITDTQEATQGGTITITPNNPVTITVPPGVTNTGIQITQHTPLPTVNIQSTQVDMTIPEGTQVSGSDTIKLPEVKPSSSVNVAGARQVDLVISVGSELDSISFTKPVRLVLKGQASKSVGFIDNQGRFREIKKLASLVGLTTDSDADAVNTALTSAGRGEGAVASGSDLIVWTKHFTEFVAYIPKTSSTGSTGGIGSTGGSSVTPGSSQTIPDQADTIEETTLPDEEEPVIEVIAPVKPVLKDISGHWAQASINQLVNAGAVSGYPDGTFQPDNTITRAEFAAILVKAFNLEPRSGQVFNDTSGHWAQDAISTAFAHGIVNGYDATSFGPDNLITREQMAVMISQAANLSSGEGKTFADSSQIAAWAKAAVAAASGKNIISGYPDNTFRPQANATRAEAVTVIVRALN